MELVELSDWMIFGFFFLACVCVLIDWLRNTCGLCLMIHQHIYRNSGKNLSCRHVSSWKNLKSWPWKFKQKCRLEYLIFLADNNKSNKYSFDLHIRIDFGRSGIGHSSHLYAPNRQTNRPPKWNEIWTMDTYNRREISSTHCESCHQSSTFSVFLYCSFDIRRHATHVHDFFARSDQTVIIIYSYIFCVTNEMWHVYCVVCAYVCCVNKIMLVNYKYNSHGCYSVACL